MRHLSSLVSSLACAVTVALSTVSASAHIELVEPAPRYALPGNKSCPCGDGDSNRTCRVTAEESTDPNRSTNVATFEAGSTITVVADEYIDHAGRMRVAFDPDGADLADFNENILMDVADPRESGLSMANPRVWELQVQLPTTPCDNCTLQVIQAMHGDTVNPVLDPAPLSTYYTCADIRIVPQGTLEAGEGSGSGTGGAAAVGAAGAAGAAGATGEAGAAGAGSAAGAVSAAGAGSAAGGAGAAGAAGSRAAGGVAGAGDLGDVGAPVVDSDDEEEADSGCSITSAPPSHYSYGYSSACTLGLLGLMAVRQLSVRRRA